ncbi:hypothetical protein AB0O28_31875 [Microbispora sp. NPDC088329]|uniref:hypothetical protein n=1 Tax=Microbispora sp. NPDC088329 TaxID=3154869 RepID=UPI003446BD5E
MLALVQAAIVSGAVSYAGDQALDRPRTPGGPGPPRGPPVPIDWVTYDRGYGRTEIRTIQVMSAPAGTRFPHVKQVFLLERHVYDLGWKPLSAVAVLGVTNLTAELTGPRRLAELVRGEWSIETEIITSGM